MTQIPEIRTTTAIPVDLEEARQLHAALPLFLDGLMQSACALEAIGAVLYHEDTDDSPALRAIGALSSLASQHLLDVADRHNALLAELKTRMAEDIEYCDRSGEELRRQLAAERGGKDHGPK